MKKILLFLVAVTLTVALNAQTKQQIKKWMPVINAIAQVESGGNPKAVSKSGTYVGLLQIAPICVRECNRIVGKNKFTYNDRHSKEKSIEMFIVFQEYHNPEGNMEKAIRLWNSGDKNCMKNKSKTEAYYRRVMSKYDFNEL